MVIADLESLKTELTTDPMTLGYSGTDDFAASDIINANNYTLPASVPMRDVLIYCASNGIIADIEEGKTVGSKSKKSICLSASVMFDSPHTPNFDANDANIQGMMDVLISEGVMTAQNKADLVAMAVRPASRSEILFGAGVSASMMDVHKARRI